VCARVPTCLADSLRAQATRRSSGTLRSCRRTVWFRMHEALSRCSVYLRFQRAEHDDICGGTCKAWRGGRAPMTSSSGSRRGGRPPQTTLPVSLTRRPPPVVRAPARFALCDASDNCSSRGSCDVAHNQGRDRRAPRRVSFCPFPSISLSVATSNTATRPKLRAHNPVAPLPAVPAS
jgi:hypothetical protein